ncbi:MAG TPA: amino acid adenylation domain-containing protein [Thermoanaerobaculia bacterium]
MSVVDRISALTPEQRALFEKLRERQRKAAHTHQPPPVSRVSGPAGEGDWPLSFDQERYWFMEQLQPSGAGLNIAAATRMRGPLEVPAVVAALDEIVRRHAAWRTTFPLTGGGPVQRVAAAGRQRLARIDLSALPEERREAEALRLVGADAAAPFDLERGPLVRASLIRLSPRDHVCLLTAHHLVVDFLSFQIAWTELAALYASLAAGRPPGLPEPPVQYPDFAVWQRQWLRGEVLEDLESWWRERLEGFPLVFDLPTDRPRPAVMRMRGGRRLVRASRELSEALRTLARQEGATLFMAVLAAAAALLHRESGQERLILGANNANRNRPELQPALGTFLTQVPFPLDLAGDPSVRELLARVRQSALGAYAHQDLPFGKLVEAIQPRRDTSRQPVIQTLVQVLDGQFSRTDLAGVTFEAIDSHDGNARYDLMLTLFDHPEGLSGSLEYDADLFDPATAERLCELLLLQAAAVTVDPDRRLSALPALTPEAHHQVLAEWSDTARPLPGWTVPERFAAQAASTPGAIALIADGGAAVLTFGELDRRAEELARRLSAAGVRPESRVALLLDRTGDLPAALLAVWKAGGVCVPLDPASPAGRLAALLEDAAPALVIHRGPLPAPFAATLPWLDLASPASPGLSQPGGEPLPAPRSGRLAYMIYTSGTTGLPKAVEVEHGSLAAVLAAMVERFGFGPGDRMPHLARFSFDISLLELFAPLLGGGACEILRQEEILEPAAVLAALARATRFHAVPSLMRQVAAAARLAGAERFAGLRTLFTGGDLVPPALLAELREVFPAAAVVVLYGPTEGTIVCTYHSVPPDAKPERTLIGRPFANAETRVIDRWGDAPLGAPGELWIGGPGVTRGYFRRPELTAERFAERDGRRYYRTGDLVRHLADGTLEFLGRADLQVKIRGFRVEPGEIEAQLAVHPAVREAAVVALDDARGEKRLVAFCVPAEEEGSPSTAVLRDFLGARLPAYMVPSAFVFLPDLPVTAHGKLDRPRLPAPELAAEPEDAGAPPRTPAEELVAGIWSEVLGLPRVSRTAHFFDLGGHSLLATQVATRLREALGIEIPVRTLFQAATVAELAAAVAAALAAGDFAAAPPILPVPRQGDLPLSFAQERLWLIDRMTPGRTAYNIALALAVRGDLSVPALAAALGEAVRRHETLRTTFREREGRPVQVIAPAAAGTAARLPRVDLSGLPAGSRAAATRRLAGEEAARPFDLERGPVLRATLLEIAAGEHALLLDIHHIAADGWSMGVLIAEIAALYGAALAGAPSPLPELPVQYADFAVWQRRWLSGEVLERQLAYWRERLADAPALALPTDRPRPARSFAGAIERFSLGAERTAALAALARRHGATLFMALLAAFEALLGRTTAQDDVVVGSPIANRNRAESEGLIGFFVNSLVLRGDLRGDPAFRGLLARTLRMALEAYGHQDLPFERLVEELRPERRLAQNPLFQVVCALQNAPLGRIDLPGLSLAPVDYDCTTTRFDLELMFWEVGDGLVGQITYSSDLFDPATVRRLARHLETLIGAALADPGLPLSRLPLLAGPERHQLLREWNDTACGEPASDVVALFERRAVQAPEAPAVVWVEGTLTYGELDLRAGRLARRLRALGVGPDVPVGLYAPRSPEMVIGALAALKAGAAYVPLDPAHPADRLAFVVRESRMPVVLAAAAGLDEAWEGVRIVPIAAAGTGEPLAETVAAPPESLAYVIYTSGSTGRPKGVEISRAGLANLVRWHLATYGVTERDRATQVASPSFDAAVWEVWPYLAAGAALHVPDEETRLLPERLLAGLAAEGITLCFLPTPLAEQLLDAAERGLPPGLCLRALLVGGDRLVRVPRRPLPFALVNHYGPTESSVVATWAPVAVPAGGRPPAIGRPVDGTRTYVLDRGLDPAPAGVPGELAIAGAGLARGYLGRPDLTAERFVPDPFASAGERMYRTGDLARQAPDGALEFLGRLDHQVKVRGFRIELGEIEGVLARHPEVDESAVALREEAGAAGGRLVAYVVPRRPDAPASAGELEEHVAQWQTLYDETYGRSPSPGAAAGGEAPTFNIQGWDSSYTGEPIPAAEMREWVDGTVARLLALEPRCVLEVGCGTGLLLFRVAPHAERYRGTDFSGVALAQIRAGLDRLPLPQVELSQRLADDWTGVQPGDFDLVVLNSVVQYFPGVDYLVKVLEGAVATVVTAPGGGAVFVGDVRSLPLLEAFHASVQLHRAEGSMPLPELARRVERHVADEEELVVDPGLFLALARRLPAVRRVQVLLKRGRHANELTRFRYDVVLHVGGADPRGGDPGEEPRSYAWGAEGLGGLERLLAERPAAVAISGVPNARLAEEAAALELLAADEVRTVEELRAGIGRLVRAGESVDPEELWALADRLGYDADLTGPADGADGRFDALLRRRGAGIPAGVATAAMAGETEDLPWSVYANDPLRVEQTRRLVPELRRFLEAELPDYMVPSSFVLLDALPLNASGKLDRAALPAPERTGGAAEAWVPPATPLEELLARVVAEVLGLDQVGMRDNFFDLGGHSLLATQLVSRLSQEHGLPVTLQMVFDAGDLGELADQVMARELESADDGLLAEALRDIGEMEMEGMEGMSPEELQALLAQAAEGETP